MDSATSLAELLTRPWDGYESKESRQVEEEQERFLSLMEDDDA